MGGRRIRHGHTMGITQEDLLGYLLSALEPHEMRRIDAALREDPKLQQELAAVQQRLQSVDGFAATSPLIDVPQELAQRTLAAIPNEPPGSGLELASQAVSIRPLMEPSPRRRRWADVTVMAVALVLLLGLGFPLLARVRGEARRVACQDNLRQLGVALSEFVMRDRDARMPGLAESGPEAFAGVYAVRLAEQGLLGDSSLRWCPATKMPQPEFTLANTAGDTDGLAPGVHRLVSRDCLQEAIAKGDVARLRWLQQVAGGDYAYSLGVMDGDRYDAPRFEGRSTFAVLGDAPLQRTYGGETVDVAQLRWPHGGDGANLLYEDGSVRFAHPSKMLSVPDHPYMNHRGWVEAGVNIDDAALAPSWRPPFIQVRQR